jgi:hypothetical protein
MRAGAQSSFVMDKISGKIGINMAPVEKHQGFLANGSS